MSKDLCAKNSGFGAREPAMHSLAPCFSDLAKNENCPYQRQDLFDECLNRMTSEKNTTTWAYTAKEGLFLKSLGKSALNKNAAKDLWSIEIENAWIDFRVWLLKKYRVIKTC